MIEIQKHLDWHPNFKNEINLIFKGLQHEFTIILKEGEDIEIEFCWDYGFDGRGTERMYLPANLLEDLIEELEKSIT